MAHNACDELMTAPAGCAAKSVANKRVMQLRQLASVFRRRAISCNKIPDNKGGTKSSVVSPVDSNIRPRTVSSTTADSQSKLRIRSLRKQRYYGSSSTVVATTQKPNDSKARFRLEPADSDECEIYFGDNELPTNPVMVEDPEIETRWYIRHFLGREHQNFAGIDNHKSPFFLSVQLDDEMETLRCRAILWQSSGAKKLVFPCHQATQKPFNVKHVIHKFSGMNDLNHSLKEITDPKLQSDLLMLEEQEGAVNFKFGVIYAEHDQLSDDDMLSNEEGSPEFENLLDILGEKIQLHGWSKFRGGLDAKTNSTGKYSYYTMFEGREIMYHVSTLLPYSSGNKQQLERKRHIGNDIVNIVFQNGGDPTKLTFSPEFMKSHFTHIFAVVTFEPVAEIYRLWVFSEESVPAYGPALPNPAEFQNPQQFQNFLLTKLINGEKSSFRSHIFAEKRQHTNDLVIKDMYMEYIKKEINKNSFQKTSDNIIRVPKCVQQCKDLDPHLLEFLQIGEHLKLTKSLNGEAPNLLSVNHLYRKRPWEPQFLSSDLPPYDCIASDSWGNRSLLLCTEACGTISVNEAVCTVLFDQMCQVVQVNILENFGILIAKCVAGKIKDDNCGMTWTSKECYLSAFSLVQLRSCIRSGQKLEQKEILKNKISNTKGCQCFSLTGNQSFRLYLVVCIGRKISLLKWKLSQIDQPQTSADIADNFEFIKEVTVAEDPLSVCVFESGVQANVKAAVVNKYNVDIVDFNSGLVGCLYKHQLPKASVTSLIASSDVNSEDILLTFHNSTLVFDLYEADDCPPLSISWTSDPKSVAYCFPFVLAFGSDAIEIRLAVNGNLFASLFMPNVKLLSSKDDIFFLAEDQTLFWNNSRLKSAHTNGNNNVRCLYKIPVKNLMRSDDCTSPSNVGARSPLGGASPKMNRVPSPFAKTSWTGPYQRTLSPVCSRLNDKLSMNEKLSMFIDHSQIGNDLPSEQQQTFFGQPVVHQHQRNSFYQTADNSDVLL